MDIYERIINILLESRLDELSAETMLSAREKANQRAIQAKKVGETGIKGKHKPKGKDSRMRSGKSASSLAMDRFVDLRDKIDRRIEGRRGIDIKHAKITARQSKGDTDAASKVKAEKRRAVRKLGLKGKRFKVKKS